MAETHSITHGGKKNFLLFVVNLWPDHFIGYLLVLKCGRRPGTCGVGFIVGYEPQFSVRNLYLLLKAETCRCQLKTKVHKCISISRGGGMRAAEGA